MSAFLTGTFLSRIRNTLSLPPDVWTSEKFDLYQLPVQGLSEAEQSLLKLPGNRNAVVQNIPVQSSGPVLSGDPDLDFFEVQEAELLELCVCRHMTDSVKGLELFTQRMEKGAVCVGVRVSGLLVGYAWAITGRNLCEDYHCYKLTLPSHSYYVFDTYLQEQVRGRGLYAKLLAALAGRMLSRGGFHWYYVIIDQKNTGSIKAHRKLGAVKKETLTYCCILGLHKIVFELFSTQSNSENLLNNRAKGKITTWRYSWGRIEAVSHYLNSETAGEKE